MSDFTSLSAALRCMKKLRCRTNWTATSHSVRHSQERTHFVDSQNETLMTGYRSSPPMKMCEMVGKGGGRRPEWVMELWNRKRNWPS